MGCFHTLTRNSQGRLSEGRSNEQVGLWGLRLDQTFLFVCLFCAFVFRWFCPLRQLGPWRQTFLTTGWEAALVRLEAGSARNLTSNRFSWRLLLGRAKDCSGPLHLRKCPWPWGGSPRSRESSAGWQLLSPAAQFMHYISRHMHFKDFLLCEKPSGQQGVEEKCTWL